MNRQKNFRERLKTLLGLAEGFWVRLKTTSDPP